MFFFYLSISLHELRHCLRQFCSLCGWLNVPSTVICFLTWSAVARRREILLKNLCVPLQRLTHDGNTESLYCSPSDITWSFPVACRQEMPCYFDIWVLSVTSPIYNVMFSHFTLNRCSIDEATQLPYSYVQYCHQWYAFWCPGNWCTATASCFMRFRYYNEQSSCLHRASVIIKHSIMQLMHNM